MTRGLPVLRLVAVVVATAGLWTAASVLSRAAHQQRLLRGERAASSGDAALAAGRVPLAVTSLREAVALEPDRPEYRLALAKALVAQGHNREALPYVNDVLRQEPVHGEASLVLARILRDTGARTEAESAYYRAIFGRWAPAQLASRQQARLELVALYEQAGDTARLRAALLELSGGLSRRSRPAVARGAAVARVRFRRRGRASAAGGRQSLRRPRRGPCPPCRRRTPSRQPRRRLRCRPSCGGAQPGDEAARTVRDLAAARALARPVAAAPVGTGTEPANPQAADRGARTSGRVRRTRRDDSRRLGRALGGSLAAAARADADVGYALLEAAARLIRALCPAPARDDAAAIVFAGLTDENRDE